MKAPTIIVVLVALLLPSGASADSLQQTLGSKILVTECNPHRHTPVQAHPWIDPYGNPHDNRQTFPSWDAFLAISYKNQAPVTATEIDFGLVARGALVAITKDVGEFSPNTLIDHEFVVSSEIFPLGTTLPQCAVLRVKYADGSVWHNPTPPEPWANPPMG